MGVLTLLLLFSRLGLKTGWIGKLGDEENAKQVADVIDQEKVKFLGATGNGTTGYSVILYGEGRDRSLLTYKGINNDLSPRDVKKFNTKAMYISTMMGFAFKTAEAVVKKYKKKCVYAFNPSLYLAKEGLKKLSTFVDDCDLLVLNREEAIALTGGKTSTINHLLCILQSHAKRVVITDGSKGAYAYDGKDKYTLIPSPTRVVETTGAGDAFAAGTFAGLLKTNNLKTALQWGYAEASSVLRAVGAKNNLLTMRELKKSLSKRTAPIRVEALKC